MSLLAYQGQRLYSAVIGAEFKVIQTFQALFQKQEPLWKCSTTSHRPKQEHCRYIAPPLVISKFTKVQLNVFFFFIVLHLLFSHRPKSSTQKQLEVKRTAAGQGSNCCITGRWRQHFAEFNCSFSAFFKRIIKIKKLLKTYKHYTKVFKKSTALTLLFNVTRYTIWR